MDAPCRGERPVLPYRPAEAPRRSRVSVAIAALVFCCLLWGVSFPLMQIGPSAMDRAIARVLGSAAPGDAAARAAFNGWRFLLAAGLYALVIHRRLRRLHHRDLHGGIVVGLFFGGGMFLQLNGLRFTPPSVSAFLTAIPFTPIAQSLFLRRPVGGRVWAGAVIACIGMLILSQSQPTGDAARNLTLTPPIPYLGQILTVIGALLFTAQIIAIDVFGKHQASDPAVRTLWMLAATGLINLLGAIALGGTPLHQGQVLLAIVREPAFAWAMPVLVVFSSVLAMHLMNIYQPFIAPALATVVYCTEPLFGTIFSIGLRTEVYNGLVALGGVIILIAVLVATLRISGDKPPTAA